MTIRRIDKTVTGSVSSSGKSRGSQRVSGENFSALLESVAPVRGMAATFAADPVGAVGDESNPRQRRDQLEQTGRLLETLETLEKKLTLGDGGDVREQLRETRDQALSTLSNSARGGAERDLLHRTAVLATVELEKSSRGDYH